jgi:hypothetical protein
MTALALAAGAAAAWADTVKPLFYGPFFMNQLSINASPLGYQYVLTSGFYHFQVGWIEPISESRDGLFGETYFETNGNLTVSLFTSDIGTTFNLKPMRYLELGLSYNRLVFQGSMVSFARPNDNQPDADQYTPSALWEAQNEVGGADIFTYQANLTFDIGRTQLYFFAARTLWDIDAKGKNYVFEYTDDFLIKTRDRVNNLTAQYTVNVRPWSKFHAFSFQGVQIRDQFWNTDHTELMKNLVSLGITGFRMGQNPERQRRGLDLSVGYWTTHNQIPDGDVAASFMITADWKWNIHFLKI